MTINRSLFFIVASIICFVIGLLLAVSVIHGGNQQAWLFGGLAAFAASFIP